MVTKAFKRSTRTVGLTIRIDEDLMNRIKSLRATAHNAGYEIDLRQVFAESVARTVSALEKEAASLCESDRQDL